MVNLVTVFRPGLFLLAALVSGTAAAQLPQNTYACEVQTKDGVAGLVLVQADTVEEAKTASGAATAHKVGGGKSPAVSVVECIDARQGSFRDSYFQNFYEKFPK